MRAHLAVLAVVVVLALVSSSSPACAAVSESRASHEASAALGDVFEDRANLFFRTMDADGDNHLSASDAAAPSAAAALAAHLPGVSAEDFAAFVEVADSDGDHRLSRDELKSALLAGAPEASEAAAAADDEVLVETSATATTEVKAEVARRASMRRGRRGIFSTIKKGVKDIGSAIGETLKAKIVDFGEKVLGRIDKSQDGCVMCQYLVERMESNVRQAAVFPSFAAGPQVASALSGDAMPGAVRQAAARTAAAAGVSPAPAAAVSSFLELAAEQTPMEVAAAGMIATTRAATRYQRTMERQKYNEIYRIVDLTLDDVCEQGMPNAFYGYCKQVYNVQPDVVDGLRYQYRPSDICFRIGMCSRASYIARGMHSRYIETA